MVWWNSEARVVLHIRKLCVGVNTVQELRDWQAYRLRQGVPLYHRTRNTPKRQAEILDGGSLYWIIRGRYGVRQRIIGFERESAEEVVERDPEKPAKPHCLFLLDAELVGVVPRKHSGFQGWRYLQAGDAPADLTGAVDGEGLDSEFIEELRDLGILV